MRSMDYTTHKPGDNSIRWWDQWEVGPAFSNWHAKQITTNYNRSGAYLAKGSGSKGGCIISKFLHNNAANGNVPLTIHGQLGIDILTLTHSATTG